MGQTSGTSRCWPSSRTRKIKSAVHTSASNCLPCRRQNRRLEKNPAAKAQEYLAGTNPNDQNSKLKITAESFAFGGSTANLTWNSVGTRYY